MQLIIYSNGVRLFIQANEIIRDGLLRIIDPRGVVRTECMLNQADFFSIPVSVPPGRYLVQIRSREEVIEKKIYL